jgi:hypothetical protein
MLTERVAFEMDPAPLTVNDGVEARAVAKTCPTVLPLASTRSTRPGTLTVPLGSSSQVQRTPKLSV